VQTSRHNNPAAVSRVTAVVTISTIRRCEVILDTFPLIREPATLLAGASVALACAVASHLPDTGGTIPLNVITALIGALVVIIVLLRSRRLAAGAVL
jgi:ABC-type cobalamin transport system permease subunit